MRCEKCRMKFVEKSDIEGNRSKCRECRREEFIERIEKDRQENLKRANELTKKVHEQKTKSDPLKVDYDPED